MAVEQIEKDDIITVLKWPEKEEIKGRVTSVMQGTPAGWQGAYYEVPNGIYQGKRLFAFRPQIVANHSSHESAPSEPAPQKEKPILHAAAEFLDKFVERNARRRQLYTRLLDPA